MPATVIIGGQWGDEGKGRVVDFLSRSCSVIAATRPANNAGHTIVNDLGRFGLHLVPAGIFNPGTMCIVGNGVVINPRSLLDEIAMLNERGVDTSRVRVSDRAHVVMPWHLVIDELDEQMRGEHAIGTTGTGTGPAFTDKTGRLGVRMIDLVQPESLDALLSFVLPYKNRVITELYGGEPLDHDQIRDEYREYGRVLRPYVTDTARLGPGRARPRRADPARGRAGHTAGPRHGTYPYVTSSVPSSMAAGACLGVGLGPTAVDRVVGVYKAYQTRVGDGPFPTELFGEEAAALRDHGIEQGTGEYGTTTGRPRRCGWFDGVLRAADGEAQRRQLDRPDTPRRARAVRRGARLRGVRAQRQAHRLVARLAARGERRTPRSTRSCPAGAWRSPTCATSPTCRRKRGPSCDASRISSTRRSI